MATGSQDWDLVSSYAGLLILATASIYTGAFSSLKASRKTKDAAAQARFDDEDDEDDEEDLPDRLSSADAYMFPILGSVMLVGFYLVVKFLGKEWINWLLGWYFTVAGVGSVWRSMISLAKYCVGSETWKSTQKFKFLVLKGHKEVIYMSLRTASLGLLPLASIPSISYSLIPGPRKSVFMTDILALSFAHNALSILKIDTFQTGCILLSGLFVYDVWWVFGTDVMVKVATSLDLPIKILWPKSLIFSTERGFTMLGLGDIVIPGMFITLALRYDLSCSGHQRADQPFAKPFFSAALGAYVIGLCTTMGVMHFVGAAQPALLYLSPACILSFLIVSSIRGKMKEAWAWKDEAEITDDGNRAATSPSASVANVVQEQHEGEVDGKLEVPTGEGSGGEEGGVSEGDQEGKPKKKRNKKRRG